MIKKNNSFEKYNYESRMYSIVHLRTKKVFLQLGKKFTLPDDIVKLVYNMVKGGHEEEEKKTKRFHKNLLLLNTIVGPYRKKEAMNLNNYEKEEPFNYRIPIQRGCEWAIQKSSNKKITFDENNSLSIFKDIREKLFFEIRVIGENEYLYDGREVWNLKPANKELKILYLNKSPFEEVMLDYLNFLEWKGTPNDVSWKIVIDKYGDSQFLTNL